MGTADIKFTLNDLSPYVNDILIMLESGVFSFKNGSFTIHRDKDGKMRKIDSQIVRYVL